MKDTNYRRQILFSSEEKHNYYRKPLVIAAEIDDTVPKRPAF